MTVILLHCLPRDCIPLYTHNRNNTHTHTCTRTRTHTHTHTHTRTRTHTHTHTHTLTHTQTYSIHFLVRAAYYKQVLFVLIRIEAHTIGSLTVAITTDTRTCMGCILNTYTETNNTSSTN